MHFSETRQLVEQACEFPVNHNKVVEQLGKVEVTAANDDSRSVAEILEVSNDTTYHSADELYTTIVGNLDDAFVGRKYYDDRAGVRMGTENVRNPVTF